MRTIDIKRIRTVPEIIVKLKINAKFEIGNFCANQTGKFFRAINFNQPYFPTLLIFCF